jgi:protein associated with RNAse G/E
MYIHITLYYFDIQICDLYEDEELSITDKETFEKALGAYLRSEKLIKLLTENRDSLLSFVKANMPT